jgi:phosphatidylserine/phosphatidylglycerophosphate/cardiolipin synthase-like enzyme
MRARIVALGLGIAFLLIGWVPAVAQPPVDAEHSPQSMPQVVVAPEAVAAFDASLRANADVLDALYAAMKQDAGGRWEGVTYALTNDNALDSDWVLQTPKVWGLSAADVKDGAGVYVADRVTETVASAQSFVDITTLSPFPTGRFESAIVAGLRRLAQSGRPVTVRYLAGWYPGPSGERLGQSEYLRKVIQGLQGIPNSKLRIFAGAMRVNLFSWNHAKIVAVDGRRAVVGGQNLWDDDYLQVYPAHDLSVALNGSSAFAMHAFADTLWESVCKYTESSWRPAYWESGWHDVKTGCQAKSGVVRTPGPGTMRVLGAGRLAQLGAQGNAADLAFVLAFRGSRSTIRIAQQDLGLSTGVQWLFWEAGMQEIAKALVRRQHVYIVLSNDGAKAGPNGASYSSGVPLTGTADRIKSDVAKQPGAPTGKELIDLLCSNLHLTTLRFGPSDQWSNGFKFANHSKFWMVDDQLFYVGSENLYPSDLQEYGVILNDPNAASQMKQQYWDKLWQHSRRVAISGSEAARCYFR